MAKIASFSRPDNMTGNKGYELYELDADNPNLALHRENGRYEGWLAVQMPAIIEVTGAAPQITTALPLDLAGYTLTAGQTVGESQVYQDLGKPENFNPGAGLIVGQVRRIHGAVGNSTTVLTEGMQVYVEVTITTDGDPQRVKAFEFGPVSVQAAVEAIPPNGLTLSKTTIPETAPTGTTIVAAANRATTYEMTITPSEYWAVSGNTATLIFPVNREAVVYFDVTVKATANDGSSTTFPPRRVDVGNVPDATWTVTKRPTLPEITDGMTVAEVLAHPDTSRGTYTFPLGHALDDETTLDMVSGGVPLPPATVLATGVKVQLREKGVTEDETPFQELSVETTVQASAAPLIVTKDPETDQIGISGVTRDTPDFDIEYTSETWVHHNGTYTLKPTTWNEKPQILKEMEYVVSGSTLTVKEPLLAHDYDVTVIPDIYVDNVKTNLSQYQQANGDFVFDLSPYDSKPYTVQFEAFGQNCQGAAKSHTGVLTTPANVAPAPVTLVDFTTYAAPGDSKASGNVVVKNGEAITVSTTSSQITLKKAVDAAAFANRVLRFEFSVPTPNSQIAVFLKVYHAGNTFGETIGSGINRTTASGGIVEARTVDCSAFTGITHFGIQFNIPNSTQGSETINHIRATDITGA
ncbi:hypothetical protein [uncultured Jannaschia sp.]|uniref:hypothetical protein n=1 Tax=uncultured Jannaschia sp. TaxID=293347 RepID=UPI0026214C95|nr:hypothetical protein [uncultured Jannaschia sp.]